MRPDKKMCNELTSDQKGSIRHFVQKTLGCSCPDDVFNFIELGYDIALEQGISIKARINIGNRLLLYVINGDSQVLTKDIFAALKEIAAEDRDSNSFNRVRMVICTDGSSDMSELIGPDRDRYDDRLHIHIVKGSTLPF